VPLEQEEESIKPKFLLGRHRVRMVLRLAVILMMIGWGIYYRWLSPARQLERSADALRQVKSLRYSMVEELPLQRNEFSGGIVCSPAISHDVKRQVVTDPANPSDVTLEFVSVGHLAYARGSNGGWSKPGPAVADGAEETCRRIAGGASVWFLPDYEKLLSKGDIKKAAEKNVDGRACQQYQIATERIPDEYEYTTVCLGLDDKLPIQMTTGAKVYTYSDFNQPVEIEDPSKATRASGN
jgi:hypothetical protein